MATTIHVNQPAVFPTRCVRCMTEENVSIKKFTDSSDAAIASFIASVEIPVCEHCRRAPRRWTIAWLILFLLFIASSIPFALAQDKGLPIPSYVSMSMLFTLIASLLCIVVAKRVAPVRLVANKIDHNNLRITFFNKDYADAFFEANKASAKVINPWKCG